MTTKSAAKTDQESKKHQKVPFIFVAVMIVVIAGVATGAVLLNKKSPEEASSATENDNVAMNDVNQDTDLGDKYVDLENRNFAINGKVYTLGKTTLQELINDGVPFDEDDIANAGNNLNKNHESESFNITLGEHYDAQVRVINNSDQNQKIADCKLSQIYLPIKEDQAQNTLKFAFPLTLTKDELLQNAGEPTAQSDYDSEDGSHSDKIEYKVDSERYYGNSGYSFEFVDGKLHYVTINYK